MLDKLLVTLLINFSTQNKTGRSKMKICVNSMNTVGKSISNFQSNPKVRMKPPSLKTDTEPQVHK